MLLRELYEAKARRVVAIMPGGFHPFHPGHKSLYDWAVKTFGQSNVYVAATNDTKARPFPFEIKKKLAAMAGVPESNFMQVKSPFNAQSYTDLLDSDTALVFVRSQKDKAEHPLPDQTKKNGEPGYLRTYTGKDLNTADEMGYMAYGPTINFDFSGMQIKSASELRATWPEMSDEDKLNAAKLMYGNGAPVAVKLLNQALGDPEAPVGEAIDQRKAEEIVKNAIQHLLNHIDDKKITPPEAHKQLDDDLDGMIEDGYNLASDPKFRDLAHKMLEEYIQRMMAREDASSDEEDEFHRKLDKLVHKTFGHSSDEKKKKKKKTDEVWGFAAGRSPKRATVKKKKEKFEPSIQDKIAARRKAAAKGDQNAWKSKKELVASEAQLDEIAPAIGAAVWWILRWIAVRGAWPALKWLLKKLAKYIIGGSAAAIAISEGWEWVTDKIGEEATQMLIDNKFTIAMAVTLILGAVVIKKWIEKHGEKFAAKYAESLEQGDLSWMN